MPKQEFTETQVKESSLRFVDAATSALESAVAVATLHLLIEIAQPPISTDLQIFFALTLFSIIFIYRASSKVETTESTTKSKRKHEDDDYSSTAATVKDSTLVESTDENSINGEIEAAMTAASLPENNASSQ